MVHRFPVSIRGYMPHLQGTQALLATDVAKLATYKSLEYVQSMWHEISMMRLRGL
ncbi:MAG: hypothetical protein QXP80_04435 [Zestosphaera sp.]